MDLYSIANMEPYDDLIRSVQPALAFLQSHVGYDCWTVARKVDDEYIVVAARDRAYGIAGGEVLRWSDTLCARMALGLGPRVAPALAVVPAYTRAPFARHTPVGAYLGVPLHGPDGDLIGSLAALHPTEMPNGVREHLPMVEAMAKTIAGSLAAHVVLAERGRVAERAMADASTDPLTGVGNRRAWEWTIAAEEERCARFRRPAAVISLDVDGLKQTNDEHGHAAGDDLLRRAAVAISSAVRAHDVVARLGGDEFGVLAIECDGRTARRLAKRIARALEEEGVRASMGIAGRADGGLAAAVEAADAAMYAAKRHLRATR
ncbi:MAG TPA: sensor domain-containing diguanylate cyclase [Egibacteraceae bacterium]|nr:sensor domain-containing diguanylate cyclase [Egibacteraceae bacterium]